MELMSINVQKKEEGQYLARSWPHAWSIKVYYMVKEHRPNVSDGAMRTDDDEKNHCKP